MVDNVVYCVWLSPQPRRFGWSQGPDTPDTGGRHDWPPLEQQGHTFHWIRQNFNDMPDTVIDMSTAGWLHQKNWVDETDGVWHITDFAALQQTLRDLGFGAFADFLETSPRIPRVGDPS